MAKLNQIIAIEKGIKSKAVAAISEIYKVIQKPALFNGFQKTYLPVNDDGDVLPPEKQRVQFTADQVLKSVAASMTEFITITERKDYTNQFACASVSIDGVLIIKDAPVTFLLFLEKQLTDLNTFVATMPLLDEGENWVKDVNSGLYKSDEIKTHRTKKVQEPLVLYPATPEHPAQTQIMTVDVIAGFWTQVKMSGAIPKPERDTLLAKINTLHNAIKEAREEANMKDEMRDTGKVAGNIFSYLGV